MKKQIYDSDSQEHENNDQEALVVNHKNKILKISAIAATCAALTICVGRSVFTSAEELNTAGSADNTADCAEQTEPSATETTIEIIPEEEQIKNKNYDPSVWSSNQKFVNNKKYYMETTLPQACQIFTGNDSSSSLSDDEIAAIIGDEPEDEQPHSSIIIEDTNKNILKEIPVGDSLLNIPFDVTDDEKIYYMKSDITKEQYQNSSPESQYSLYTVNDNYESEKLFDIPSLTSDPVFSADSNGDFYICIPDNNGVYTLDIFDHSGNIKSTVPVPSAVKNIFECMISDSELLLIGENSETDDVCSVSVDTNTLQAGQPCTLNEDSETISKDGSISFTYFSTDETDNEEAQN